MEAKNPCFLQRLQKSRKGEKVHFLKLTLTSVVVIEIVPWEAGSAAGAKMGQNEVGVT